MADATYNFFSLLSVTQNGGGQTWLYSFDPADTGATVTVDFGNNNVPDPNESVLITIDGSVYSTTYIGFGDMIGSTTDFDVIELTLVSGVGGAEGLYGISTDPAWSPNSSTNNGTEPDPYHYTSFCFVRGALITTTQNDVAVEDLKIGDLVLTRDNGPQTISWIGNRDMCGNTAKHLLPIRIKANALGGGLPKRDLLVSPQHRVLISDWRAELMFGASEVLVAAKHLVNDSDIRVATDLNEFEYYHILFESHQTIFSEGLPTESFHPGDMAMKSLSGDSRDEVLELFPALRDDATSYGSATHTSLKAFEARALQSN
ncbi:hypothetical protein A9Q96_06950 [Rhodobacterales bacterium 52_120_T64]|nr:hypothetical protein A9Q96_06950 [Rhodobacterales bacterium 52_120_T64]